MVFFVVFVGVIQSVHSCLVWVERGDEGKGMVVRCGNKERGQRKREIEREKHREIEREGKREREKERERRRENEKARQTEGEDEGERERKENEEEREREQQRGGKGETNDTIMNNLASFFPPPFTTKKRRIWRRWKAHRRSSLPACIYLFLIGLGLSLLLHIPLLTLLDSVNGRVGNCMIKAHSQLHASPSASPSLSASPSTSFLSPISFSSSSSSSSLYNSLSCVDMSDSSCLCQPGDAFKLYERFRVSSLLPLSATSSSDANERERDRERGEEGREKGHSGGWEGGIPGIMLTICIYLMVFQLELALLFR